MNRKKILILVLIFVSVFIIGYKNNFFNKDKNEATKYLIEKYGFKKNEIKIIEYEGQYCGTIDDTSCSGPIVTYKTSLNKKITVRAENNANLKKRPLKWGDDHQMEQIKNDIVKYFQFKMGEKVVFATPENLGHVVYSNNKFYNGQNIESYFSDRLFIYVGTNDIEKKNIFDEYVPKFREFASINKVTLEATFYDQNNNLTFWNINNDYDSSRGNIYEFIKVVEKQYCKYYYDYNKYYLTSKEISGCR